MSKTYTRFLASLVTALTKLQSPERAERNRLMVRDLLTESHVIETDRGKFTLICKERREAHYAHHFFDREPETLNWIGGFKTPCTFWDVGANTGIYSLYAALNEGVKVYAFEPAASSYAALYANIHANGFDRRITGLCMGFFDKTVLAELRMDGTEAGSAMHDFGDMTSPSGPERQPKHLQRALTFSIDDFCKTYRIEPPTYLKIDVDSVEEEILLGAKETLGDERVRAVLVELVREDAARYARIVEFFAGLGFAGREEFSAESNIIFSR